MDKTNYPVLSIIAIVAIVAIIAIFFEAHGAGETLSRKDILGFAAQAPQSTDSGALVGFVVADFTERSDSVYDLNNDGLVNSADATVLAGVVNREYFCPPNKRCDLDNDGVVRTEDLGALNALILSAAPVGSTALGIAQDVQDRSVVAPELQVGAFGGMIQ